MHDVNILPLLSLARFFLTQQLIYMSKIEKHNNSFCIRHQYSQKPSSTWIGEKTFQLYKDPYSDGSDSGICVAQNKKKIRGSGPYHRGKKLSALINDWENDMHMGSIQAK